MRLSTAASLGEFLQGLLEGMPGARPPGDISIPMERPSQPPQQSHGPQHLTQHPALRGLAVCVCLTGSSKASEMKEVDLEGKPEESQPPYHVLARNLLYPGSHTLRFPVPDEKVPWEVGAVTLGSKAGRGAVGQIPRAVGRGTDPLSHPCHAWELLFFPALGQVASWSSCSEALPGTRRDEQALFLLGSAVLGMPGDARLGDRGNEHPPPHFLNQGWLTVRDRIWHWLPWGHE